MARRGATVAGLLALALAAGAGWLLFGGGPREEVPAAAPLSPDVAPAGPPAAPPPVPTSVPEDSTKAAEPEAPPPAPAGRGVLVVRVVGLPAGTPVAGAAVEVREDGGAAVLASRTTGADGIARFEGLVPDAVRVQATAAGWVPERQGVSDLRMPGERSITVDLEPGVAIGGIVLVAGSRRPVAGARIVAEKGGTLGGSSTFYMDRGLTETVADAEGRFRVEGIPRGEIFTLKVEAPGFVPGSRSLLLGEGAEEHPVVEILVAEAASAVGVVRDPDGRPVAGASVGAFAEYEDRPDLTLAVLEAIQSPWGSGLGAACKVKTGEDGRFIVDGLAVGTLYRLCARAPGFARSPLSDPPVSADAPGQQMVVDLRLRRPSVLRVRVADAEGRPPEGAGVDIIASRGHRLGPEAEGPAAFRFDALLAGEYRVEASCAGFRNAEETVALGEAESKEVRIVLVRAEKAAAEPPAPPKPGSVRMRLVPPRGMDLPARCKVTVEETVSGGGSGYIKEPKDGLVLVDGIPQEPVRIVVFAEGFAPAIREVQVASGEERDLGDIHLDLGAEFTGTVQDAGGNPLAGARVVVYLPGFEEAVATAGADGRFRVSRLPPGEHSVRVAAQGLLDATETVAVGSGATNRSYTLVPAVEIRGTVRTGDGKPAKGVRVALLLQGEAPPGVPREVIEDPSSDGVIRTEVAAGSYVIEVRNAEGRVLLKQEAAFDGKSEGRLDLVVP